MMKSEWPEVPLGELLSRSSEVATLNPNTLYKEVTIRLWGKGVVVRREATGAEIGDGRRFQVRTGQFILSKIDARNGAFGLVPNELDRAVVTNDFPSFNCNEKRLLSPFLGWLSKTREFVESCRKASEGTTNRVRLKEDRFYGIKIPLPSTSEQKRIVARINKVFEDITEAQDLNQQIEQKSVAFLRSKFANVIKNANLKRMELIAPLVRRKATIEPGNEFPELGVRCFGKGTFHKPALDFMSVGSKKLYKIEPSDLVFSNVFAWEGAIAVAQQNDVGRFGSHRFITCVAKTGVVLPEFLCFYFLTPAGLNQIGAASPGGAGRNRTLGLKKLAAVMVPVPEHKKQLEFCELLKKFNNIQIERENGKKKLKALLPSILDKAFKGEF